MWAGAWQLRCHVRIALHLTILISPFVHWALLMVHKVIELGSNHVVEVCVCIMQYRSCERVLLVVFTAVASFGSAFEVDGLAEEWLPLQSASQVVYLERHDRLCIFARIGRESSHQELITLADALLNVVSPVSLCSPCKYTPATWHAGAPA